ncbi:phage tail protein [Corallococcus sp. CA047B]|uniref:phage tail protein n=1 Tax=Corallococcus sp. CA047B TaxID=2316729 RepID=UPI000EA2DB83|nr:phage tail protein [Corallococcus sp. CA047B]RKH09329.1 phage tail protein [Corallococcus sp. CA047B]
MNDAPQYRKPLGMPRKFHKRITIGGADYDICEPSSGDKTAALASSRKAGELDDKNHPVDEDAGMHFLARIAIVCLYHPGGVRRVFEQEENAAVKNEPWLDEYGKDFSAAFGGPTVEEARGNSEATPS